MDTGDTLIRKAESLRRSGKSYSEISKKLGIPKSTLSSWFADKKWSQKIKLRLLKKQRSGGKDNLASANKARQKKKESRHARFRNEARNSFEQLKNNPLFLVGISIYWGEGEKANQGRVSVINTDPNLLKIVANFYRECLEIQEEKLRIALYIYDDIDENEAIKFWSKELNVPRKQFIKTQVLKSRSKRTRRRSKYGICNLYFSNTELSIKIREWISLLSRDARV